MHRRRGLFYANDLQSLQHVLKQNAHPLMSTILIRTLMDRRYFHGIRTLAAAGLSKCATASLNWIGQFHLQKAFKEFFCLSDSSMPRANDFSDRMSYLIQKAIPRAMARIRDDRGKVPMSVRKFFVDKLKFNDNSNNEVCPSIHITVDQLLTLFSSFLTVSMSPHSCSVWPRHLWPLQLPHSRRSRSILMMMT